MLGVLIAVAFALVASACGSGSSLPPADELPELEFGQGEMPVTVPEGFPLPDGTTIGSTMIDGSRVRTEVVMIFPANSPDVVKFYEKELPEAGYEVTEQRVESTSTHFDFNGHGIDGTMTIRTAGLGLTEGFLVFVYA